MPNAEKPLGYVTLRVPIMAVTDSESWEIPEEYTYLRPSKAEIVGHDIPERDWQHLRADIQDHGVELEDWTIQKLSKTNKRDPEIIEDPKLPYKRKWSNVFTKIVITHEIMHRVLAVAQTGEGFNDGMFRLVHKAPVMRSANNHEKHVFVLEHSASGRLWRIAVRVFNKRNDAPEVYIADDYYEVVPVTE